MSATTAPASSAATLAVCAPGVPGQAGDLRSLLRDAHITAQGSEGFRAPSGTDQVGFEHAVSALLRSPTDAAPVADLEALGFAVLCFEHQGGSAWYVLQDRDPNRGGGTFAFNLAPARKLIVEAPHADSDLGTLAQAVDAGVSLGARAVLLNGASRCATATLTTCNGTSGPCGALRISDAAHDPDAFFTSAHRALRDAFPDELAVSLHGMSPQFGEAAVVSDGTRERSRRIDLPGAPRRAQPPAPGERPRVLVQRRRPTTAASGSCARRATSRAGSTTGLRTPAPRRPRARATPSSTSSRARSCAGSTPEPPGRRWSARRSASSSRAPSPAPAPAARPALIEAP